MLCFSKKFHGQSARGFSQLPLCTPSPFRNVKFPLFVRWVHTYILVTIETENTGGGKGLGEWRAEGSPGARERHRTGKCWMGQLRVLGEQETGAPPPPWALKCTCRSRGKEH